MSSPKKTKAPWWHTMGPGIVSGASDNDPTTVASLAVIGSTTTYALGWLVILVIPMLAVVQAISSSVGAVTRKGLERVLRERYGPAVALLALTTVLAVNVLTLAADLEGGGAAVQILTGLDYRWFVAPIAGLAAAALIFGNFAKVQRVLVYIPLVFLAYVAAAFLAHPNWHDVILASLVPHLQYNKDFAAGAIALLGTTLTAYAYVWQTIEIAEEKPPLSRLGLVQIDAVLGVVIAGATFWFIVVATGATLGVHHKTVETAQQAASALAPVAGHWASLIFGIGLLGSTLIAVPVLGATCAYVTSEMFGWRGSIDSTFWRAKRFYVTLLISLAAGCAIALAGVSPIKLLFISSIAGGIATPVTLGLLMAVANDRRTMTTHRPKLISLVAGWMVFSVVTLATGFYFYQSFTAH
ncbi:MAG: divalent metal cation transporter [Candidatus Eremiobacteraeota bacterium]|nr:divalent metal cation transporter [Candidatus Eremiobacteraeota bacterium]